jgi:outer membrane protein assembly factor BamD (BamD/ComL family)
MFRPKAPPPPAESLVLRGDKLEAEAAPVEGTASADLAGAHVLFRQGDYKKAEKIYHRVAENTKNAVQVAEEARFYEAECLRLQGKYPKAADTYNRMTQDFRNGAYREQAQQHMFEIANYWLDDTREQMRMEREKREGKRWFSPPNFVHWADSKPLLDEEGRALEKLEQVRLNDMTGPFADKALFLTGSVAFFNEDYKEADHQFSQLVEFHPKSPLAEQAVELGIISKHMSTGGSDYDGRKVAEARQLVDVALRSYPTLAAQKDEFLKRQLIGITLQQAEKDYKMAEFWRRTGHPASAYFYYELVRRRYPGTRYADLATERMHELRAKVEKEQGQPAPKVEPMPTPPPAEGTPLPTPRTLPDLGR